MNQRILSCPSTLLTKGLTMKAGDWKTSDATPELLDVNRMKRIPDSAASLPNSWKLTRNNSSSLFRQQLDVHRISSSSLSQSKTDFSNNVSSNTSKGNASWDDKVAGGLAPKQSSGRLTVNLLDLVQLKMDDPFKQDGQRSNRNALLSPSEPVAAEAPRRQQKRLSTILDIAALDEEDEAFGLRSASSAMIEEKEDDNAILDALLTMSRPSEEIFLVKTFNEKATTRIDLRRANSSELELLKEKDPFMYYSIPAVREAACHGNNVDMQAVKDAAMASDIPSSYARKTCISVESCLLPDMDELDSRGLPSLRSTFYNTNMDIDDDEDEDADDWLYEFSGIQAM